LIKKVTKKIKANLKVREVVNIYHEERPHMSCGFLTPNQAHSADIPLKREWKSYYKSTKSKTQH
jgi:hypothetical protein